MTGKTELESQYFTQTILPAYVAEHPEKTAKWDVTYDARGHFAEPHTRIITPLGTLDVRRYLADVNGHTVDDLDAEDLLSDVSVSFPTCGPANRFSAVVFIEKEGLLAIVRSGQTCRALRHCDYEHQGYARGGLPTPCR